MGNQREWVFGKHKAHLEGTDVLLVKMGGPVGADDARALIAIYQELSAVQPFFAIMDVSGFVANADARKVFTQELRQEWFLGMVFVGASMVEKAVTKAMTVALYLAGKWKMEFLYTDTTDQARATIGELRNKRLAATG
ncbi:hypothetical protein [Hyalangium versicolor]|uniref:hypothetical protein n=1 Tax=Hyalangium versicolor TaxID=2861190 RepID=UPI001CCFB4C5|nr:hypothetical protein [Hyalangium versicolor]